MNNLQYGGVPSTMDIPISLETASKIPALPKGTRQPLGVLLVCTRNARWHDVSSEERQPFDLSVLQVLKFWEKKVGGRIYRVYAGGECGDSFWEFFTLLECEDLPAWKAILQNLEQAGFNSYFDWDIIAFGRSIG